MVSTSPPHLAARQFADEDHVAQVIGRLKAAGVARAFVIGGDGPVEGPFADAASLLRVMNLIGHSFDDVGIGGYPEGHAGIPADQLAAAMQEKSRYATRIVTHICFDAKATARWAADLRTRGITQPVYVGMPGPVHRTKLMRISASIGLGQSARFLRKQNGLWRFLLPGGYNPSRLARQLGAISARSAEPFQGLHIFTFNEIEETEKWRRRLRTQAGLD